MAPKVKKISLSIMGTIINEIKLNNDEQRINGEDCSRTPPAQIRVTDSTAIFQLSLLSYTTYHSYPQYSFTHHRVEVTFIRHYLRQREGKPDEVCLIKRNFFPVKVVGVVDKKRAHFLGLEADNSCSVLLHLRLDTHPQSRKKEGRKVYTVHHQAYCPILS